MKASLRSGPGDPESRSIASLISGILQDTAILINKEIAAIRLEIREEIDKFKSAALLMGLGAGALIIGIILLSLMLVHLIQALTGLHLWICYGIVAGTLIAVAGIVLYSAKQRANSASLVPARSVENAKEDARWITSRVKYDAK
jgi:hypothetical protein